MNSITANDAVANDAVSNDVTTRWSRLYNQVPLCDVPRHYAGMRNSRFLMQYLQTILHLCPRGERTLETGIGSGYGAIWLSRRGCRAEGIDLSPHLVQRAREINNMLGGQAQFATGDLFRLFADRRSEDAALSPSRSPSRDTAPLFHVIHHQGVLEHFTVPQIRAALAQQVALARHVVFSVPSVHYPFDPEFGDERLLSLEEWEHILKPFTVTELRYYGDPQHGEKEHVLAVLRGEKTTPQLLGLMKLPREPYPDGISAIVHTRNEAGRLEECLQSLQGWTDEIIVCDMESTDATVEIARRLGAMVLHHPLIANFDRARNTSAMRARYRWIFYLDADERVPTALAQALKALIADPHIDLDALLIPFRHHFAGHWMRSLYPGYTMPRLFRNGRFHFGGRLHGGAVVEGKTACFPAGNPELALIHYSYDSLAHYLDKLNRYTDGEAANMHRDGHSFHWQQAIRHWVHDFASYYDQQNARQDGVHGLIYSFLSAFYRFEQHAKLYEKRYRTGQLTPAEGAVPSSVEEVLQYALAVLQEKPLPQAHPISVTGIAVHSTGAAEADSLTRSDSLTGRVAEPIPVLAASVDAETTTDFGAHADTAANTAPAIPPASQPMARPRVALPETGMGQAVVWSGPLLDPSGYGEESRQFLFGLDEISGNGPQHSNLEGAALQLAAQVLPWSHDEVVLPPADRERLQALVQQRVEPGFIHVTQNFPLGIARHLQAAVRIGRTMFETDRLPLSWVKACNRLDYIWVPTEFNRQSFADAGVAPDKLAVVPGCLDAQLYREEEPLDAEARRRRRTKMASSSDPFVFLAVFDWTLHKGWDVLLRAFLRAFEGRDDVALILKVWSTMGYGCDGLRQQAVDLVRAELDHDLAADRRVRFVFDHLPAAALRTLFRSADAFVLPSRGEGWGRPYMEAMACGLPTIGTNWSGNTAFMTCENSYLLRNRVMPVPERGWREIPTYQGHRWAEPEEKHLIEILQQVAADRETADERGVRAREVILEQYDRRIVAHSILQEIERIRERHRQSRPVSVTPQSNVRHELPKCHPEDPETDRTNDLSDNVPRPSAAGEAEIRASKKPITVRWEGAQFCWHSLGLVNRELSLQLINHLDNHLGCVDGVVLKATAPADTAPEGITPPSESSATRDSSPDGSSAHDPVVELSLVPTEPAWFTAEEDPRFTVLAERFFAPLSRPAQVHVRHFFPPRFERPDEGRLVLMQPWEYGFLPVSWIEPIRQNVDEIWCYSEYVRQVYRESGIPEEKLQIVPLGVDTNVFHPAAPPYVFTTEAGAQSLSKYVSNNSRTPADRPRSMANRESNVASDHSFPHRLAKEKGEPFIFLFTGGTLHRKGIDILLEAYCKAFTALDEVCLVIKDTGTDTVYRGGNERERILQLIQEGEVDSQGRPSHGGTASSASSPAKRAPLIYLDHELSPHQLAGLYTASDCLIQPYRGEGFCLPALEAMACGIPVIVPAGGPTDDFVDETVGWRIAAARKPFEVLPTGQGRIGPWDCCGPTWMWEIEIDALARLMREVASRPELAQQKGREAALRVRQQWTWRHAGAVVKERLGSLSQIAPDLQPREMRSQSEMPTEREMLPGPPMRQEATGSSPFRESSQNGTEASVRAKPRISLCMIARDEERVLGDCLHSIRPHVDEIVLVDTGSMDGTVEIAKQHGAQVYHFPWCDDFSAARNESLQHASGDWILWMDADDTIPADCGVKLRELAEYAEEDITGFLMQVHIPPAPGEEGFTIVDHLKLFRNLPELRFEGRIHEQILEPIYRMGGRVERSDLYVVHSGYDYSPEGQRKKRERDLRLLQKDLEERPGHPFVLFNIGMTAHHLKEWDKAIEALEECLLRSKPFESTVRKAYAMLAGSYLAKGDLKKAVDRIEKGLALFPHDPELLFRAGIIYREAGNLGRAEHSYLKLLTNREVGHIDSLDVSMTGFKAHHNLALIYQDMDRWQDAEAQFHAAVRANPRFTPSWLGRGEVLLRQGRHGDLRQWHASALQLNPEAAQLLLPQSP